MPFAAALSTAPPVPAALAEVCDRAARELGPAPDLAVLFFSPQHLSGLHDLAADLRRRLAPRLLLGCVAESVIANEREVENRPALALWVARWARPVSMTPFHL